MVMKATVTLEIVSLSLAKKRRGNQIWMGGRGFGDLRGKEIGEDGSEGRRGEGDIEVGSVLDGEGMERVRASASSYVA